MMITILKNIARATFFITILLVSIFKKNIFEWWKLCHFFFNKKVCILILFKDDKDKIQKIILKNKHGIFSDRNAI